MRVYVGTRTLPWEYTEVGEVFVNENDAKKWVADQETKVDPNADPADNHVFGYQPRELRTGWNG